MSVQQKQLFLVRHHQIIWRTISMKNDTIIIFNELFCFI